MTRRKYIPRAFAPAVADFFAEHPRCALWAKPGMGKSVLTLSHLEVCYSVMGETEPTLVLAPLRVARDGWAHESSKWEHLAGFDVVPVVGDTATRIAALKVDAPVYTTNYEQLNWLCDYFSEKGRKWPFRRVVADEATRLKSFRLKQGSVRAQALAKFAHVHVKEFIELVGTPSPNGLKDLWGQMWFLDQGQRLGRSYASFEERWFAYKRIIDAISHKPGIVPVIQPFASEQIHERLADICMSLDPKDWFDLQEPIVNVIEVELSTSAKVKYRELEKELFAQFEGMDVEVFNAAGLTNKCLQLANGAVYLDPERYGKGAFVECDFGKIEALTELVEETGDDPILVAYQFKSDLARLLKAFPDALDLSRDDHMAGAKAGKGKVWLGHPASVGNGVDGLQAYCNRICFFAQDWNLEYHDQILERVGPMRQYQEGKTCGVFIDYIVARDTLDEVVMGRRSGKASAQAALMDYMKRKA